MSADQTSEAGRAVGQRVRRLRLAQGTSLSALARAAGIGKATLSGLEHGTRNATLETLHAVAGVLGVPITSLVLEPGAPPAQMADVHGSAVTPSLIEVFHEPGVTFELLTIRVRPGMLQDSPAHAPGVTEHLTVTRGRLRAGTADAPAVLRTGEHHSWRADTAHVYEALDDEEATAVLLIRSPVAGTRPTRTDLSDTETEVYESPDT
ncbi:helix-turn-helix domain-containing protein [Actinoplanes sichuanensis]|uniref:XRE family transcriptional regulator n=1 Tax=Actinoplanes sichuanensis TaxID=512349 RepID=A0ABW4A4K0_9ACTN|nr:XRE family transcriptional regulator [Actinoplanes sichuanensis]